MDLIKLYTTHGPMHVDAAQLAGKRNLLTIYTARGNRLSAVAKTQHQREQAGFGVHRENLFASPELAEANYQRIITDIASR